MCPHLDKAHARFGIHSIAHIRNWPRSATQRVSHTAHDDNALSLPRNDMASILVVRLGSRLFHSVSKIKTPFCYHCLNQA